MGDALTLPALFFLLSLSGHQKAAVLAMVPPLSYEAPTKVRYYGKVVYELARFASLRVQASFGHWSKPRWVLETTLRLDHKNLSTFEHSERSTALMEGFGKYLGWSAFEIEDGILAAGMHDMGKLFIPISILEKPAKLTAEETTIMRKHVTWSVRCLRWMPGFERLVPIVANHHESYDGKGYPLGLVANEIARVTHALAIVDTYDAITNARYYKPARTVDWAMWEIRRNAATQFDPELVEKFIAFMGYGDRVLDKEPSLHDVDPERPAPLEPDKPKPIFMRIIESAA